MTGFSKKFWVNENNRWSYMTDKQLATRLGKITRRQKLEAFITMAKKNSNDSLEALAWARYGELFPSSSGIAPDKLKERGGRVETLEENTRLVYRRVQMQLDDMDRALDF